MPMEGWGEGLEMRRELNGADLGRGLRRGGVEMKY